MQSVKNAMPSDFSEKFIYKLKSDVSAEEFARIALNSVTALAIILTLKTKKYS